MKKIKSAFITSGLLLLLTVFMCFKSYAHCDTLSGPVIKDARIALEKNDVTPVLKWVKKDAEPQIRKAFNEAISERAKGRQENNKADMKFFETLVRIHRAGEGASFTGLKPEDSIDPVIAHADKALDTGSSDTLNEEISKHLTSEIKKRFDIAFEKKKHKDDSVQAGREYVEAYVEYVHYIEAVHTAISQNGADHHE